MGDTSGTLNMMVVVQASGHKAGEWEDLSPYNFYTAGAHSLVPGTCCISALSFSVSQSYLS